MSERNILDEILAGKAEEVAAAKAATPADELRARIADLPPTRSFAAAIKAPGVVRLVAEVKKASPSAGVIRSDFEPVMIAEAYQEAGAAAISVLTDARWFQGSPDFLRRIRSACRLPILRKDFVLDEYQLLEARAWGADAALLIVAALSPGRLAELIEAARELRLTPLVEVHADDELDIALEAGARVIGINNRDLKVFKTDLQTTLRLRPRIPEECAVISESGIRTPEHVRLLREHDVDAMLVGEALMRQRDLALKTRELVDAGRGAS